MMTLDQRNLHFHCPPFWTHFEAYYDSHTVSITKTIRHFLFIKNLNSLHSIGDFELNQDTWQHSQFSECFLLLLIKISTRTSQNKLRLVEVGGGVEPLLSDHRPALRVVIQKARLVKSWLIMTHDDWWWQCYCKVRKIFIFFLSGEPPNAINVKLGNFPTITRPMPGFSSGGNKQKRDRHFSVIHGGSEVTF